MFLKAFRIVMGPIPNALSYFTFLPSLNYKGDNIQVGRKKKICC